MCLLNVKSVSQPVHPVMLQRKLVCLHSENPEVVPMPYGTVVFLPLHCVDDGLWFVRAEENSVEMK